MTVPSRVKKDISIKTIDNPVLASTISSRRYTPLEPSSHLIVSVTLECPQVTAFPTAMIDSGATSNFINRQFALDNGLPMTPKEFPRHPRAIDGHSLRIVDQEVHATLRMGPHSETIILDVVNSGRHPIILGTPWFHRHNPTINWRIRRLTFPDSYCSNHCLATPVDVLGKVNGQPDRFPPAPILSDDLAGTSISARIASEHQKEAVPVTRLVPPELHDMLDVFDEGSTDTLLPPHRPKFDCTIDLVPGAELPKPAGLYAGSAAEAAEMKKWLDEHLAKGFIRPSTSQVASPCFWVGKKDGKKRIVIDYRKINDITVKNQYPIPLISELIERLRGKKYFTKLDLRSGYHLVRIAKGHEWKTAFKTRYGLFEWTVMPLGLSNAPAVFQRFMNNILHDLLDEDTFNYLDDTLIGSVSRAQNLAVTRIILERMRKHKCYIRAKKCEFAVPETEWLGLYLTGDGVAMDEHKVAAIKEWPVPRNVKDIQTFLGFANFYRHFIKDFAKISQPITNLLRKDTAWDWSLACQEAFDVLKGLFTSAPILEHHDPDLPSILETDASGYAYGAVLSQKSKDGRLHPNGFMSKSMTPAERRYDIYDKEMLGVVRGLQHFRPQLEGAKFPVKILTDHKNLEYFKKAQVLNDRQHRWLNQLQRYDFTISYRPGPKSGKPDALSRRPDHRPEGGAEEPAQPLLHPSQIVELDENFEEINADDDISEDDKEEEDDPNLAFSDSDLVARIPDLLAKDASLESILAYLKGDPDSAPASLRKEMSDYRLDNGLLRIRDRIYVPHDEDLKRELLHLYHDTRLAGHKGQAKTLELLSRGYFWPSMKAYVNRYIESCDTCQRNKSHHAKPFGFLKNLSVPTGPWQDVSYDFIVKLPKTPSGNDTVLVFLCRLLKQAHFIATREEGLDDDRVLSLFIHNVWKHHGTPLRTVSDRGTQLKTKWLKNIFKGLGIKMNLSTAYQPSSDGQTEVTNATGVEDFLRTFCNHRQDDWDEQLPFAEFAYNNSVHSSTGVSPFMASLGYNPTFTTMPSEAQSNPSAEERIQRIHTVQQEIQSAMTLAQERQKRFFDRHRQAAPEYEVGQKVWLSSENITTDRPSAKLAAKRLGPFEVRKKISSHAYELALPPSMKNHPVFHISRLTPHVPDSIPGRIQVPPPPVVVDDDEEWEVEDILSSKYYYNKLQYLVKWKGYPPDQNTWEPFGNVEHAIDLVNTYHARFPDAAGPSPTGVSARASRRKRR